MSDYDLFFSGHLAHGRRLAGGAGHFLWATAVNLFRRIFFRRTFFVAGVFLILNISAAEAAIWTRLSRCQKALVVSTLAIQSAIGISGMYLLRHPGKIEDIRGF